MDLFTQLKKDSKSFARAGIIHTPHGAIETPSFIPVGTKASVKTLTPQEILDANSQAVLANTYHLYLSPGLSAINSFGGFAPFMGWSGPTFTDSGGYQVSFLWHPKSANSERASSVKITDEGAHFRSHIDGSKHLITPEKSMEIQAVLGADLIMAFDQPLGSNMTKKRQKEAFTRTLKWEERSFASWREIQKKRANKQALYGVVQGETDGALRKESLNFILSTGFPAIAIGGETIGADPKVTAEALDTIAHMLPADKPVHALGLGGGVEGVFEAVGRGIDTFDNTSVTRMARTGIYYLYKQDGGRIQNKFRQNIKKCSAEDHKPISKVCKCFTCSNFSTAYIRHLIMSEELLGGRLLTIHNIFFMNFLLREIRDSILGGKFMELKGSWID